MQKHLFSGVNGTTGEQDFSRTPTLVRNQTVFTRLLILSILVEISRQQYFFESAPNFETTTFAYLLPQGDGQSVKLSSTYPTASNTNSFLVVGTKGFCEYQVDISGSSPTTSSSTCSESDFKKWNWDTQGSGTTPVVTSITPIVKVADSASNTGFFFYVGVNYPESASSPNLNKGNIFKIITSDLTNVRYLSTTSTYSINSLEEVPGTQLILAKIAVWQYPLSGTPWSITVFDLASPPTVSPPPKTLSLDISMARCHKNKLCLAAKTPTAGTTTNFYVLGPSNYFDNPTPTASSIVPQPSSGLADTITGIVPVMSTDGLFIVCQAPSTCALYQVNNQLSATHLGSNSTSRGFEASFRWQEANFIPRADIPTVTYNTNKLPEFNLASATSVTSPAYVPAGQTDFVMISHSDDQHGLYIVRNPTPGAIAKNFMMLVGMFSGVSTDKTNSLTLGPLAKFVVLGSAFGPTLRIVIRKDCHSTCRTCIDAGEQSCTLCYAGFAKNAISGTIQGNCAACSGINPYADPAIPNDPSTSQQCLPQPTSISGCNRYLTDAICLKCQTGNYLTDTLNTCNLCLKGSPCTQCVGSATNCTACSGGLYVTRPTALPGSDPLNSCTNCQSTGYSMSGAECVQCADKGCLVCQDLHAGRTSTCSQCDLANGYYRTTTYTCKHFDQFSPTEGMNKELNTVENCASVGCIDCKSDYATCKACDSVAGYILENDKCILIKIDLSIIKTITPNEEPGAALPPITYIVEPSQASIPDRHGTVFNYLIKNAVGPKLENTVKSRTATFEIEQTIGSILKFEILWSDVGAFLPVQSPKLQVRLDLYKNAPNSPDLLTVRVTPLTPPQKKQSQLKILIKEGKIAQNSSSPEVQISAAEFLDSYTSKVDQSDQEYIDSQVKVTQVLTGAGNIQSTSSSVAYSAVLALDPTGTAFRLVQTLQTLNKLYFINVPFGYTLDGILKPTAYSVKESRDVLVRTSQSVAGRLYEMQVPISVAHSSVATKIWLYWFVWGCKALRHLLIYHTDFRYNKAVIYLAFWTQKVHLVLFNLVFVDFAWIGPRTLLQSRNLNSFVMNAAYATLFLLVADFLGFYTHLQKKWVWLKFKREAIPEFSKVTPEDKDGKQADQATNEIAQDYKQINYKKTYFEIEYNKHLVRMVTGHVPVNTTIEESKFAALVGLAPWYRIVLLQLVIISCQSSIKFGLIVLSACEATRIFLIIYCHLQHKLYKSTWHLLSDLCNSLFITTFLMFCLFLSGFGRMDLVPESYQTFGFLLTLTATVLEYFLLLAQIVISVIAFLWMRKMKKSMGVEPKPWRLIFYYDAKEMEESRSREVDQEGREAHSASNLVPKSPQPSRQAGSSPNLLKGPQVGRIPDIFLPVSEAETLEYVRNREQQLGVKVGRHMSMKPSSLLFSTRQKLATRAKQDRVDNRR